MQGSDEMEHLTLSLSLSLSLYSLLFLLLVQFTWGEMWQEGDEGKCIPASVLLGSHFFSSSQCKTQKQLPNSTLV